MSLDSILSVKRPDPRNVAALRAILDSLGAHNFPERGVLAGRRFDAGETMLFSRMLEHVSAEIIKTDFPELKARALIPMIGGVPAGADTFTWRRRISFGQARWIGAKGDDLPGVTAEYKEESSSIKQLGLSFSYSVIELLKAQMAGVPLPSDLALDAREVVEREIDEVAALGDSARGIYGFLKGEDAFGVDLQTKAGDGYTGGFLSATGANMLADLQKFAQSLWVASSGVYSARRIVMDPACYSRIAVTPYSATIPDTVLEVFLRSNPTVREVVPWNRCDTADAAGTGPRWVAYDPAPQNAGLVLPVEYATLPPQARGLMIEVPGYTRFGGCVVRKPMSMTYLDGILA